MSNTVEDEPLPEHIYNSYMGNILHDVANGDISPTEGQERLQRLNEKRATPTPQPQNKRCPTCNGLNGHQPTDFDRYGAIHPDHRAVPDLVTPQPAVEKSDRRTLIEQLKEKCVIKATLASETAAVFNLNDLADFIIQATEQSYQRGYAEGKRDGCSTASWRKETDRLVKEATERAEVETAKPWNDMLEKAAGGEVIKITHNGVELTISSLEGMSAGMKRVVNSAITLGQAITDHKAKERPSESRTLTTLDKAGIIGKGEK